MSRLNRAITRFTVAFSYRCDSEKDYINACDSIDCVKTQQTKLSTAWLPIDFSQLDSDLFLHIQKDISRNPAYLNESIGSAWVWNKNSTKDISIIGVYTVENIDHLFNIDSSGIFLFKTGIGILWFEIGYKDTEIEFMIKLNCVLKDISFSDRRFKLYRKHIDSIELNSDEMEVTNSPSSNAFKVVNKKDLYIRSGRLSGLEKVKKVYCKSLEGDDQYFADIENSADYSFADFIADSLAPLEVLSFFTDKISSSEKVEFKPDKAYIFSVVVLEHDSILTDEKTREYLYWLKRGYKQSYLPPSEDRQNDLYRPFENSYWSASMEGCANIVRLTLSNNVANIFFKTTYWDRFETYFFIYILVLHQHYTLLDISAKIGKLPIYMKYYVKFRSRIATDLNRYNEMINLFSMKIYTAQISHISHQNELYNYLTDKLGIKASVNEMRDTLQVVNDIVQNSTQNRNSMNFRIFVILSGIFALIQSVNNLAALHEMGFLGVEKHTSMEVFTGLILLCSILGGLLVWIISRNSQG